jgi:endonuclease/exonuclease/phosphatase family metal-dependent hydrolase
MSLELLTLNIEGDRHLDRVCDAISRHLPDVVCLQEVFEADCAQLAATGPYQLMHAATAGPNTKRESGAVPKGTWGLAVLTRIPVHTQTVISYADASGCRSGQQTSDFRRAVAVTELMCNARPFRIATTHFTWSPGGCISEEQRQDFSQLKKIMGHHPDYLLCGDLNAPRGGELFAKFTDDMALVDHVPPTVLTTIDAKYHRAGALELVVDAILATPEYRVGNVRVLDGLSDHKGLMVTVDRR